MDISQRSLRQLVLTVAFPALISGCRTGVGSTLASDEAVATDPGGTITIHVIPPASPIDWTSPNSVIRSSATSKAAGTVQKQLGRVALPHPIGHLHVSMECANGVSIPLTGQTGGGSEFASAFDGLGASLRIFPGDLDVTADVMPDVKKREASGKIAHMSFKISGAMCRHMAGFVAEYRAKGAHKFYGGQFRPRRFEGSGCTAFGLAFVELGGFLKRSEYTPLWSQTLNIGIGRISDYQGAGVYRYGSNLISYDETGVMTAWPKGQDVKVQRKAIVPGSPWLRDWYAENDAETNVAPNEQPNIVPWTIYDTEPMFAFVQKVHAQGGGEAMGRNWTVSKRGKSLVIETDATDAVPQPYLDPEDDLRKD